MSLESVYYISQIGAAAIVVGTLYFLSQQIRQANTLGTATAEREWLDRWNDTLRYFALDVQTAEISLTAMNDYSKLTAPQKAVFVANFVGLFNQAEVALRLNDKGLLDSELVAQIMDACAGLLVTKGGDEVWKELGPTLAIHPRMEAWRSRADRSFRAWSSL